MLLVVLNLVFHTILTPVYFNFDTAKDNYSAAFNSKAQNWSHCRMFYCISHFINLSLSSIYWIWIVRSTVPHLCASEKQFACAGSIWQKYKWLWINHESSQLLITDKVLKKPLAEQSERRRECKMPWRNVSSLKKWALPQPWTLDLAGDCVEPAIKMVLATVTLTERMFWNLMIEEVARARQGDRLLRGFVMGTSR